MTQPLRICAFMWGTKYTHEHVLRLGRALRRNLTIPYEFVLISDQAMHDALTLEGEDGAPSMLLPLWKDMQDAKLCGVRLRAFGADMATYVGPRFAWIDLDVVITGNVDHIFGRTEDFVALATPRPPMPYNGSLVMMDAGSRAYVLRDWTMENYHAAGRLLSKQYNMPYGTPSDEGWMWWVLGPNEARITRDDGVYYFRHDLQSGNRRLPQDARMVIMNGRRFDPSMPALQNLCPWLKEHWR